jgi:hypothetical protein
MWSILGLFGWHLPPDLPSYSTYCRADWYYRGIPALTFLTILFGGAGIILGPLYLIHDYFPKRRRLKSLEEKERKI